MSRRRKIQFSQLFAICIAWTIVALCIQTYDYFLLHSTEVLVFAKDYSYVAGVLFNVMGALIGALLAGSLFVFYLNVRFKDKPYGYSIFLNCIVYVVIMSIIILLIGFMWVPHSTGINISDPEFKQAYWKYLVDPYHLKDILVWSIVTAITQFVLLMNTKFGHGILWDIIRGKYHLPKEEMRIFMFADLNSSTTIAEKLGNERYHELLQDFFSDVTNPIIDNKGDIYQYIGDEVVVAWKYEDGIAGSRCIRCFFDMKLQIEKKGKHYLDKFGLVPGFKAGIHFGKVIAGEVGIIKRDITFSGDVLNTTSRIGSKCKDFNVDVIASDDLLSQLSFGDQFISKHLGNIKLRGKEREMGLSALFARVSV
ncbi:MAG TPA: adenylate/guanylate cyclase domain-containing protein [Chitinophagales bacterium]|nr:adenylate/guanylate cyclase domain-containing protein [Chitinophagales bacterium]